MEELKLRHLKKVKGVWSRASELTNLLPRLSAFPNFTRFALLTLVKENQKGGFKWTGKAVFIRGGRNLKMAAEELTLTPTNPGGPGGPSFPFRPISPLSPGSASGPGSPFSPWKSHEKGGLTV